MRTKNIRQVVTFKAGPRSVYEALMDSKKHAKFTVRDRKIVQAWRGSDWPEGYFSKAIFTLSKIKSGTRLTFSQTGVPEEQVEAIREGWIEHYWEKMKKFLESSTRS